MNEGQAFAEEENRDYATAATVLFFQQKLLEAGQDELVFGF